MSRALLSDKFKDELVAIRDHCQIGFRAEEPSAVGFPKFVAWAKERNPS